MFYWHPYLEHWLVTHTANDNDVIKDDYNDIELEYEIEDITYFSGEEGDDIPF